ncbi:MAG TPA: hypothetical protein VNI20_00550 [Fimbriimonadaceae bacterium]|nr:hypothetical protein [Fimbriimonadaceae bacterium]
MRLQTNTIRAVTKGALVLSALVGAASSFSQIAFHSLPPDLIQFNKHYAPSGQMRIEPAGSINTYQFFPQVDRSISARRIAPEPGTTNLSRKFGTSNNLLKAGSIGGHAFASASANFPGIEFNGLIPPDVGIGAGPLYIVETVNARIAFFRKSDGVTVFSQPSSQFFTGLGAPSFQFDPRVLYDQFNDRWIILFLAKDDASNTSEFLLAVSDDSDPNGVWNRFVVDSSATVNSQDSWFDYPMVGLSPDALVISGNMFSFSGSTFQAVRAFVIPTLGMYNNTGVTSTIFLVPNEFSIQPGDGYSAGTTIYATELENFTTIRLWAFTDVDTATPGLVSSDVAVAPYAFVSGGAPSGGGGTMATLTFRMLDTAYRGTSLVAAHSIFVPGDDRASVRWYEFNVGTWPASGAPTLAQEGNITLSDPTQWAFMPAITINALNDISVIYTRSSTSIFSDLVISTRTVSDPAGTISAPTFLRGGLGSNVGGRWGDYFAVVNDPLDDTTFWGSGEVTRADGLWSTEIQSWVVSTGGGGGGSGVDYDPVSVAAITGTYVGGTVGDIVTDDTVFYDMDTAFVPGLGHYAAIQTDFSIAEVPTDVTELSFTIDSNIDPGVDATGTVFLWNWNTSKYEYVKAFPMKVAAANMQAFKLKTDLAKYISNAGDVRVLFRAHDPLRRRGSDASPFRMRTDVVHLKVKS